jgi:hypothetical protein
MKIINDLIIEDVRYIIEFETNKFMKIDEIIKIKSFLKVLIELFVNEDVVIIDKFADYKKYDPNIIKIISQYEFDKNELAFYYIILFFEKIGCKLLKLEIEIADNDIIKIIYDDYSLIRKKIHTILLPPSVRAKFTNFFDFYNKLFN